MSNFKEKLPLFQANDIQISNDVNTVWSIANTLRGAYRADKYRDVIIPMFVLTRLEAALLPTKDQVVAQYKANPNTPEKVLEKLSGYRYYNVSPFTLENLQNDPNAIEENFIAYLDGYSCRVKDIIENLKFKEQVRTLAQPRVVAFSRLLKSSLKLICLQVQSTLCVWDTCLRISSADFLKMRKRGLTIPLVKLSL